LFAKERAAKIGFTILLNTVTEFLRRHLERVKALHDLNLREGYGHVYMPYALDRKYPHAGQHWCWQYVFPSSNRSRDPYTRQVRRHHLGETVLQKALKRAIREAGITKAGSCHTFRHSFATLMLEAGYDIRTVQELLGHQEVTTTMISRHMY
jgi:integrase